MDKKIIVTRIDELMKEKGITNYELHENADVSTIVYQWRKNAKRDATRTPSLRSIEKICEFLGVSLSYFFSFKKEEQLNLRNCEIFDAISQLNDEQKKLLEQIVKQFNKINIIISDR